MSDKEKDLLTSIDALFIKRFEENSEARDTFWKMRAEELSVVLDKIKEVATDVELIKADRMSIAEAIADIGSIKESVGRYVEIEKFIKNASKFSLWVFKFIIGVAAIGSIVYGAFTYLYNHLKNLI